MPISWTAALRLYGKQKGHFIVPRKGSPEYEAVKKLQTETEHGPEHEVKKRAGKKGKKEEVVVMEAHEPTTKAKKAPTRKGGAAPEVTRNHDPLLPPASGTKPLESAGGAGSKAQMLKEEPVVKDEVKKEVKKRKGVKSSGLTAGAETVKNLTDSNLMDGGSAAAQLPGQTKRIKKSLEKKEGEVKVVEVGNGEEKTLEGLKSDDPEAVSGRKPFSFQALRNQLLC
jgi:hypothetical protein